MMRTRLSPVMWDSASILLSTSSATAWLISLKCASPASVSVLQCGVALKVKTLHTPLSTPAAAPVAAPLELVAREREEGRTDDGDARLARVGAHQRGEHVREALARARGKEREAVAPGEGGLDRLELTRAEIRARAEVRAERSKRRAFEVVGAFEVVVHGCEEKTRRRAERSLGAHARADDHVVRAEEDRGADGADDGPPVLGVGPAKGGGAREYSRGRDVRTQL